MAVALDEYVEPLKRKVNPPGVTLISSTDADWIGRLADAFWSARAQGFFVGYRVDPDLDQILPVSGDTDLPEEQRYLIVLFAGVAAVEMKLLSLPTRTKSAAPGPVETETERSATVLTAVLANLRGELLAVRENFIGGVNATGVYVIDSVLARTEALACGTGYWAR